MLLGHTAAVSRLRCPRRTDLLISSSLDGTVRLWGSGDAGADGSANSLGSTNPCLAVLDVADFNLPTTATDLRHANETAVPIQHAPDAAAAGSSGCKKGVGRVRVTNMWAEENCSSIWAACSDFALRVWTVGSNGVPTPARYLRGHEGAITCLEGLNCSGAGAGGGSAGGGLGHTLVASGSVDKTVRVWDSRQRKAQVFVFKGHGDSVGVLRWGEGGRSLITAGKDKTVRIWDTRAGRVRACLERHFGAGTLLLLITVLVNLDTRALGLLCYSLLYYLLHYTLLDFSENSLGRYYHHQTTNDVIFFFIPTTKPVLQSPHFERSQRRWVAPPCR